jgi:O-succinylbenzoic acid--CoA ligase
VIPKYNKVHNRFKYNNIHYAHNKLNELAYGLIKEGVPYEKEIGDFILDWQDNSFFIYAKTSGSTGEPKTIELDKQAMVNSAIATGDFFNLRPGNSSLLSLPASYIAGKMMLVRAFVLGLELDVIEPKSNLNINTNKSYDFAAMVPMQLQSNIEKLNNIKQLIVGGAKVSKVLATRIQHLKTKVYETYGMTETVSHIAVKQLNGKAKSKTFKILPNVNISQDKRGCLIIKAPNVSSETIKTNDIVEIESDITFKWLGRFDNVINTGGIKVFPEQIESMLKEHINTRFFIASEADERLGQRILLILEGDETLNTTIFKELKPFERPKKIYTILQFEETTSGKIQRKRTLEKLK